MGIWCSNPGQTANRLLELVAPLGWRRGLYTELQLLRKMRRERTKSWRGPAQETTDETTAYVVEKWVDELVDAAGLTAVEDICFRLHLAGWRHEHAAALMGRSYQTVVRRLKSARRKLRRAYCQGPHAGWQEVYLSEVHRYVYRAPRGR